MADVSGFTVTALFLLSIIVGAAGGFILLKMLLSLRRALEREIRRVSMGAGVVEARLLDIEGRVYNLGAPIKSTSARVDTLDFERVRLVPMLERRSRRMALADSVLTQLRPVQERLDRAVTPDYTPIGNLDSMYKLKSRAFPYSITDEEGLILYSIIEGNALRSGFEVATAFGYSSLFIATALKRNSGRLISLDLYVEEAKEGFTYTLEECRNHLAELTQRLKAGDERALPVGLAFARESARELDLDDSVQYRVGLSPDDVDTTLGDTQLDFAFIDGGHLGGQPTRDVLAIISRLRPEKYAVMFHDGIVQDVADAVSVCRTELPESSVICFNTRNLMTMVYRGLTEKSVKICCEILSRSPGGYEI